MATYCYRCPECGARAETPHRVAPYCYRGCPEQMGRDYRAERVGVAVENLRREREHTKEEYARAFLPTNDDYKSASDPDGTKGMRAWREQFSPAADNKRPYYPGEVEKKVM